MVGNRNWLVVAANSDIATTAIVDRMAMRRIGLRAWFITVTPVLTVEGSEHLAEDCSKTYGPASKSAKFRKTGFEQGFVTRK
jgi:hypothetical protein